MAMPKHLYDLLKANGRTYAKAKCDLVPVVKYHDPAGPAAWLLTRVDPHENAIIYGLCDEGIGLPRMGFARWSELLMFRGKTGTGLVRDLLFRPVYPVSVYAHAAQIATHVVEEEAALMRFAAALGLDAAPHLPIPGKLPRR